MMLKKQILTNAEIKKDLIHAMRHPPRISEADYKKGTLPAILMACFLFVMGFVYPQFIPWFLLGVIAFLVGATVFHGIRFRYRIKRVTIEDYEITTETVHSIDEEHFRTEKNGKYGRSEQIDNYSIRFENGKIWRIPKECYAWHERLRRGDRGIYQSTHRDDRMIVLTRKKDGEIVMAYHTELFEYRD